jgi:hypothetical protein
MTTITQQQMINYTPPAPLQFSDNLHRYNGTIFCGLIPIEIEEKIMKILWRMNMKDNENEFKRLYLVNIDRDKPPTMSIEEWKRDYERPQLHIIVEWEVALHKKLSKNMKTRRYEQKYRETTHNLKKGMLVKKTHNLCLEHINMYNGIIRRWRRWEYSDSFEEFDNYWESNEEDWYNMRLHRFTRDYEENDDDRWEDEFDRINSRTNSWYVMNINKHRPLTFLKQWIKDSFTKSQIKDNFAPMNQWKNANKGKLITAIYKTQSF